MIPEKLLRDMDVLAARGYDLVSEESDGKIYLTFYKFPLPDGLYNLNETDLLIFTLPGDPYPPFDMFWTEPELLLKNDTIPNGANCTETHLGRDWRKFSYHPYQNGTWNPSDDDLATYVAYIQKRFQNGD